VGRFYAPRGQGREWGKLQLMAVQVLPESRVGFRDRDVPGCWAREEALARRARAPFGARAAVGSTIPAGSTLGVR
jgi:hypothetical protein